MSAANTVCSLQDCQRTINDNSIVCPQCDEHPEFDAPVTYYCNPEHMGQDARAHAPTCERLRLDTIFKRAIQLGLCVYDDHAAYKEFGVKELSIFLAGLLLPHMTSSIPDHHIELAEVYVRYWSDTEEKTEELVASPAAFSFIYHHDGNTYGSLVDVCGDKSPNSIYNGNRMPLGLAYKIHEYEGMARVPGNSWLDAWYHEARIRIINKTWYERFETTDIAQHQSHATFMRTKERWSQEIKKALQELETEWNTILGPAGPIDEARVALLNHFIEDECSGEGYLGYREARALLEQYYHESVVMLEKSEH